MIPFLLASTLITFDLPREEQIVNQYLPEGVSFNMSYGTAVSTGSSLLATPDFTAPFSFLTTIFSEPQLGSTISFDLKVEPGSLLVIQSYSPDVRGFLVEEIFVFDSQTVQLTDGRITFFTIIDATPRGFELDNLQYGPSEVPEPRHLIAVGLALLGMGLIVRKGV